MDRSPLPPDLAPPHGPQVIRTPQPSAQTDCSCPRQPRLSHRSAPPLMAPARVSNQMSKVHSHILTSSMIDRLMMRFWTPICIFRARCAFSCTPLFESSSCKPQAHENGRLCLLSGVQPSCCLTTTGFPLFCFIYIQCSIFPKGSQSPPTFRLREISVCRGTVLVTLCIFSAEININRDLIFFGKDFVVEKSRFIKNLTLPLWGSSADGRDGWQAVSPCWPCGAQPNALRTVLVFSDPASADRAETPCRGGCLLLDVWLPVHGCLFTAGHW